MTKAKLYQLFTLLCFLSLGTQLNAQCEATTIQTTSGVTTVYTCPGDNNDDLVDLENSGNGTTDFAYVATDENNNILGINPTSTFNFEGAGVGTCLVWGFSYTGNITAQQGDFLFSTPFSDGCFQISDNLVRVVRDMPDGGMISSNSGNDILTVCTSDLAPDVVSYNNTTTSTSAYEYIITDADNNILGHTNEQSFNFDGVPPGVCRIWGLSYSGSLTLMMGANAATSNLSDDCFDLSDNFIEVTRTDVDGGTVADANGATNLITCAGDGNDDVVTFTHQTNSGATYGYIITDENNLVLGVPPGNSQNFEGAGEGVCRVWGISYTGNLTIFGGDNILNKTLSDDCFDLSDNYIEVVRTGVDGGDVYTADGESMIYTCPGDGIDDVIEFMHTNNSSANFTYVVTDADGNILGVPPGNTQNFEGAGSGTCLVWGLSYTGTLTAMAGDNALTTALSDGCFGLSSNFVTVVRDMADGGTVSTVGGATTAYTCPGNGIADVIEFAHVSNSTANYAYVVTDDNNNILGIPPGNAQNFEGAPAGTCRVWGLSYTGTILAGAGDNAATTTLTDGCFSLSSNFVTIVREQPQAGTLDAGGATTVYTCPGDGNDDVIDFSANGFNQNFQLVITDDNYNILGLPGGTSQNFEGAGVGTCLAWGVSYTGDILAAAGDNIFSDKFSSDCWDFSTPVTVVRDVAEGGTIQNNAGSNEVTVCTTDGNPNVISYNHTTTSTGAYTYLITDDNNNILGIHPAQDFDFEGVPAGVCRIWGLSYSGTLLAAVGQNAATETLSDGCFDLSDNFIEVTRTDVHGGTVAMPSGATERYTCTQDGNADIVMFTHDNNSTSSYAYIITDSDNNVLGLPPGNSADFDGAPAGTCRVWGISYTGDLTLFGGDNILNKSLSTDCYDLSENFISIIRDTPEGGTVESIDGETSVTVTVGDGIDDEIFFQHSGNSNSNFTYVVTDDNNNILGIPPVNSQNFEGAPAGICRVWGLSYTGTITAQVGDNAGTVDLTDDCFDLSDNYVEIIRIDGTNCQAEGGELTGGPFAFTVGDGTPDMIAAGSITLANNQGQESQWVVTDDAGYILGLPPMPSVVDFDGAGAGTCLIWHVSFDTGLQGLSMGNNALTDLEGCFSISNSIEVVRTNAGNCQANGGELLGGPFAFTVGDGTPDMIAAGSITLANSQGQESQWVVTDDQGLILGLPPMPSAVNFDGAGAGTCLIWHVSFDTGLQGLAMGNNALTDLEGCFSISNSIEVVRTSQTPVTGGIVINEINGNDRFEIKNTGTTPVDISSYWVCDFPNYSQISSLVSECNTDLILDPDEVITLVSDFDISENDGEFGLYINTSWADPNSIMDYVEWGSSGHTRSTVAIAAGIWSANDFVPAFTSPMSIHYDGQGNSSTDWSEAAFSSCQGLVQDDNELQVNLGLPQVSIQDLSAYPNPTNGMIMMTLDYMEDNDEQAQVNVLSAQGQIVQTSTMNLVKGKNQLEISLSNLPEGIYFLDINADNVRETIRVIKQ